MKFGLTEATIKKINQVFKNHSEIDRAVIYGSRAKGNYKLGSDIDLTLYGENLSYKLLGKLLDELDDVLLPYTFDLSIFEKIDNKNLRDHIERVGLVFYKRKLTDSIDIGSPLFNNRRL